MSNFLHGRFERGAVALTAATAIALGSAACTGSSEHSQTAATTTSTAEQTPGTSASAPVETRSALPAETTPTLTPEELLKRRDSSGCPIPDALDLMENRYPTASINLYNALREQSFEEFRELPASTQVDYFMKAAFDQINKGRYVAFWNTKNVEGKTLNTYNPFCIPLQENANPFRVLMQNMYGEALANATSVEPDTLAASTSSTPRDTVESSKIMGGSTYPGTRLYQSGVDVVKQSANTTRLDEEAVSTARVISEENTTSKLPNGKIVPVKLIVFSTASGALKQRFVFVPSDTLSKVTGVPKAGLWVGLDGSPVTVTLQ